MYPTAVTLTIDHPRQTPPWADSSMVRYTPYDAGIDTHTPCPVNYGISNCASMNYVSHCCVWLRYPTRRCILERSYRFHDELYITVID